MKLGDVIPLNTKAVEEPLTVLVVEDDPALKKAVQISLRRLEVEVLTAEDGKKAIEIIDTCRIDLACIDLMLPHVSGFTVLEHLRSSRQRDVPVIVMSGRALPEDRARALELGAREYLIKPYLQSHLREKAHALLQEKRPRRRSRRSL